MRVKSLLLLLLTFVSLSVYAQTNSLSIARSEYKKGNYEDAVVLFNGAIATTNDQSTKTQIEKERELSSKCWEYLDKANSAYSQKRYEDAKKLYSAILGINKYDSNSSYKVKQCNTMINNAADNEYWAKVVASKNADEYANYIKKYPSGLHIAEAKNVMSNVSYDKGLWDKAIAQNTKSAYQNYLTNSKYNWHKEEAQSKVDYITDKELWAAAQKTNTKAAYTGYLTKSKVKPAYVANANAMIALFDARSQYSAKQYTSARSSFESHKKLYTLSSNDQQLYSKCCEESDYASFLASSASSKSYKGKTFLTLYPKSTYVRRVKSEMSRSYASSYNFGEANLYAQNNSDRGFIKAKQKLYKKSTRGRSSSSSSSYSKSRSRNEVGQALSFGWEMDFAANTHNTMLPLYYTIGGFDNTVNLTIGAQYNILSGGNPDTQLIDLGNKTTSSYSSWDVRDFEEEHQPHLVVNQFSFPLHLRFNIGKGRENRKFFMSFGGSYNLNVSSTYKRPNGYTYEGDERTDKFSNPDLSLCNSSNISTIGKIGCVWAEPNRKTWYDLALIVRYDVTPAYNIDAVNTTINYSNYGYNMDINTYETYSSIRNQVNNNLYIGFSVVFNFKL